MSLAHVGFAISIIGVACTTVFSVEEDVRMEPGDTQIIGPLKVSFVGVSDVPGPNYIAKRGIFDVEHFFYLFTGGGSCTAVHTQTSIRNL